MVIKYLTPFAFLALLPLGGFLGGAWTFSAAAATLLALTSFDAILGADQRLTDRIASARWLPTGRTPRPG